MAYLSMNCSGLGYVLIHRLCKAGIAIGLLGALVGPLSAQNNTIVIAAFGDSLTAGYGLPAEDGFVPQLQDWLTAQGADVQVQNAGVSGDTTAGGVARLDWVLGPEVDAVILELGANDMLRGLDPAQAKENLDQMLAAITARDLPVLIAGMRAPPNYGADYQAAFDGMYGELAEKYAVPLYPFFLQGLGSNVSIYALSQLMQADGLHPNADGVALIVADIGPHVLDLIGH